MEDHEVEIWEVGSGSIHVPRLSMFDVLRAKRHTLMHTDGMHTQFERLLKDGESHTRIIHAPGERLAIIIAHVVELKGFRSMLLDLDLHQIKCLLAFQGIDGSPEYCPVGVLLRHGSAFLPLR